MVAKKRLLKKAKLYLVLDAQVKDYDVLFDILKQGAMAGVDIFQLRDKYGCVKDIVKFSKKAKTFLKGRIPFIINDRIDLAIVAEADGVHLGQDDLPVDLARKLMGNNKIIGVSCQTVQHIRKAQKDGVDYIGFGSIFKTLTKPGRKAMETRRLVRGLRQSDVPLFAIGGINLNNVITLKEVGVDRVAVTRAILNSKKVGCSVKAFKDILNR